MATRSVLAATGNDHLDRLLQHVIAIFELVFPARIRAYYLTGSTLDGTAAFVPGDPLNSSDIDIAVVFNDVLLRHERERFIDCRAACAGLSQLHLDTLDVTPLSEMELVQHGHLTLKLASQLLYGEDIRPAIPLPTLHHHVRAAVRLSRDHIAELRALEPEHLRLPLSYPDADGEFYGYDYHEPGYSTQPGTRLLVGNITWGATALLALKAGAYAAMKREAITLYATAIDDEWSGLLDAVYQHCKMQWGYLIPQAVEERQQLRTLCAQVVAFENHCLASYAQLTDQS